MSQKELQKLINIYPTLSCHIWGATPNHEGKWKEIEEGDLTLFSKENRIFASGKVTFTLHNLELAEALWGYDNKNRTWEYIYFLEEIKSQNIPYSDFNRIVGYQDNNIIQGFTVLDLEKSNLLFDKFNLRSDTYIQQIGDDNFSNLVTQLDNLQETESRILALQRLEQGFLKRHLFGNNTYSTCACCQKNYPVSYLVTAHIKKRSHCSPIEKRDMNVVMPMCKFGCDELFEKGYISVVDGLFVSLVKNPTSTELEIYLNNLVGNKCEYFNQNTIAFFNWHLNFHTQIE